MVRPWPSSKSLLFHIALIASARANGGPKVRLAVKIQLYMLYMIWLVSLNRTHYQQAMLAMAYAHGLIMYS
jgi:ectoine hydroxylase-related dioxygenase (phytanoyl-CoA dioxygenase family)